MAAPRLLPDLPLPPYSFVPGRSPHPVSDPAGHQHGIAPPPVRPIDPANWRQSRDYLRALDLFNHGYYWEAHEAWEGLWHAAGRTGPLANFRRGLIKLAAAGVVALDGTSNTIQGNAIGTNAAGTAAVGNLDGIELLSGDGNLIGGTGVGAGNVISGNFNVGVLLTAGGNRVQGNLVGLTASGVAALANATGVYVSGANNTLGGTAAGAGNVISGSTSTGVAISGSSATGNLLQGNRVGTNQAGTAAVANGQGVTVGGPNNTIGGTAAGAGNVISGNNGNAIMIPGDDDVVQGNYIGTNAAGSAAVANQGAGVGVSGANVVIGGTTAAARNVISGNIWGLALGGNVSTVQGNYIGTDATGTRAVATGTGILLGGTAYSATIGGTTPGAGNVISGNTTAGIASGAGNVLIEGNLIGTDATGTAALGNGGAGISLTIGFGAIIGGTTAGARNVISGNRNNGLYIITPNNTVQGNYIGTDVTGRYALGNVGAGVLVNGSLTSGSEVGGTAAGAGNLISGNSGAGVFLQFAQVIRVEGNTIGTDVTGTAALGNQTGVMLSGANDTIGGTAAGAGNVISGNQGDGVSIASGSGYLIAGNTIGTYAGGTHVVGNARGIFATASGNTFRGNLIPGNRGNGLELGQNTNSNNQVQGNTIGTDVSGTTALANNGDGIAVSGSSNTIASNLISGNGTSGIEITSGSGNKIQGNRIGTDVTRTAALPNSNGVSVDATAGSNTIGGTAAGAGNLISGNRGDGVLLTRSSGNVIEGNYIGTDVTGTHALGTLAPPAWNSRRRPVTLSAGRVRGPATSSPAITTTVFQHHGYWHHRAGELHRDGRDGNPGPGQPRQQRRA